MFIAKRQIKSRKLRRSGMYLTGTIRKSTSTKKTFKEEYLEMLKKFNVEYDEKYLFKWIDEEKD